MKNKTLVPSLVALQLCVALLTGCATSVSPLPTVEQIPEIYIPPVDDVYRIQIGDRLSIRSYDNPTLDHSVTVRSDGRITVLLIGELYVNGMSPQQLDDVVTEHYSQLQVNADVDVFVEESANQVVYVAGEVARPGGFPMHGSMTLLQAVTLAGGFLATGDRDEVLLMRKDVDGRVVAASYDAAEVLGGSSPDVYLKRNDIVYVARSGIGRLNRFVELYINGLIPDNVLLQVIIREEDEDIAFIP